MPGGKGAGDGACNFGDVDDKDCSSITGTGFAPGRGEAEEEELGGPRLGRLARGALRLRKDMLPLVEVRR